MTIKLFKLFMNHEKEEMWLNHQAQIGYHLVAKSAFFYHFTKGSPMEYTYRIELLKHHMNHHESKDYIAFLEEQGVEIIANNYRWIYMRKASSNGPFNLYTDINSKIDHYRRIRFIPVVFLLLNLGYGIYNLTLGLSDSNRIYLANLSISIINFLVVILLFIYIVQLSIKIGLLKKSRIISE